MLHTSTSYEPRLNLSTPALSSLMQPVAAVDLQSRETGDAIDDEIAVICYELRNSLAVVCTAARLLRASEGGEANAARLLIEWHVIQMSRRIEALLLPHSPPMRRTQPNSRAATP